MDGEYRRRDGDEIVEPLFAALSQDGSGPPAVARGRRTVLLGALLAGLVLAIWLLVLLW